MQDIDIEQAKEQFIEFTNQYDLKEPHINQKVNHSLRVMEIAKKIAIGEGLNEEEIQLATLIGLLHDIARFRQYTEYQTFNDLKSFDHGDVGVEILKQNNYLRSFIQTDKYDDIIKTAVKNHNKYAIEEGLTDEKLKFSKLVRDADKIDIFFEAIECFWKNEKEAFENSKITPEVRKSFESYKILKRQKDKDIKNVDKILQFLAFNFDINFKTSFKIIEDEKYVEKLVNKYKNEDTQKYILEAGKQVKQYITKKLEQ